MTTSDNTADKIEEGKEVYGINRDPYAVCPADCEVVLPSPYELQLDLDSLDQRTVFLQNLKTLERDTGLYFEPFIIKPSRSGFPKCHITLKTSKPMDVWQRIALQFYLQSDPIREGLNCKRVLLQDPYPIALFELKEKETFK